MNDTIEIREERDSDVDAIRAVHDAAFGREHEGRLVDRLRSDGLLAASVVGLVDGCVVGNAVFSGLLLRSNGGSLNAVALAPLAVLPASQRRGIGSRLVRAGLDLCAAQRYVAAFVLGDPAYYSRFGFSATAAKNVRSKYAGAGDAWMALEFRPATLSGRQLKAIYPDAFGIVD
ncbi:MAG TPA: N-acetyltransferase [Candidatus Baltobacteraceae bacterium]|nr:N-acetyltransferase [Candidatus Baltobacteraceae bacterium]